MINKKQEHWNNIKEKYRFADSLVKLELKGVNDDSGYYHPRFIFEDGNFISGQCDLGNKDLYAVNFHIEGTSIPIFIDLIQPIILSYKKNKSYASRLLLLHSDIQSQIGSIRDLAGQYFTEAFIDNTITETKDLLINKINITTELVSHIKQIRNAVEL